MAIRLSLALIALAFPAGAASAQLVTKVETTTLEPGDIDSTTQTQDVRFRDDGNQRLTVAVTVAGRGPYRFIVDTGADRTAVSLRLADQLKLAPGPVAKLHSVTGVSGVRTATVRDLQISERVISSITAPLLDEDHLGADGILGTDSLRSQRILFDFKNNLLSITPATARRARDEEGTIVVQASRREGRLIVTEAEADQARLAVVLDTGSEVTIGNSALRAALARRGQLKPRGTVELVSVTGDKLVGDYTVLKKLKFGGVELHDVAIVFADAHTFRQMKLQDRPALLMGMNMMRAFQKVSIDFSSRKLRVLLPKASAADLPRFAER